MEKVESIKSWDQRIIEDADKQAKLKIHDLNLNDVIQEKLSLSDRFGITITFDTPTPKAYINIVKELLIREDIKADMDTVKVLAYRWELANHGRSGRSAVQFVKSVIAQIDEDVKV